MQNYFSNSASQFLLSSSSFFKSALRLSSKHFFTASLEVPNILYSCHPSVPHTKDSLSAHSFVRYYAPPPFTIILFASTYKLNSCFRTSGGVFDRLFSFTKSYSLFNCDLVRYNVYLFLFIHSFFCFKGKSILYKSSIIYMVLIKEICK